MILFLVTSLYSCFPLIPLFSISFLLMSLILHMIPFLFISVYLRFPLFSLLFTGVFLSCHFSLLMFSSLSSLLTSFTHDSLSFNFSFLMIPSLFISLYSCFLLVPLYSLLLHMISFLFNSPYSWLHIFHFNLLFYSWFPHSSSFLMIPSFHFSFVLIPYFHFSLFMIYFLWISPVPLYPFSSDYLSLFLSFSLTHTHIHIHKLILNISPLLHLRLVGLYHRYANSLLAFIPTISYNIPTIS